MPHYFFDIHDRTDRIADEEGTDCADLDAALEEAKASARDLAKQYIDDRQSLLTCTIEIRDETGDVVGFLPIRAILGRPH
jgi:hypothetical protein